MTIRTGWNSSVLLTDEELEELKKAQEKLEQEQKELTAQIGEQIEQPQEEVTPLNVNTSGDGQQHDELYNDYVINEDKLNLVNSEIKSLEDLAAKEMMFATEEDGSLAIEDTQKFQQDINNFYESQGDTKYKELLAYKEHIEASQDSLVKAIEFTTPLSEKENPTKKDVVFEAWKQNPQRYQGMSEQQIYDDVVLNNPELEKRFEVTSSKIVAQNIRSFVDNIKANTIPAFASLLYKMTTRDRGGLLDDYEVLADYRNTIKNQFMSEGLEDFKNAPLTIANTFKSFDKSRMVYDKVKNKRALYPDEKADVQKLMNENPSLKFDDAVLAVRNSYTMPSQDADNAIARFIVGIKESMQDEVEQYYKDNPDALATREYIAGNKLSSMKPGYVAQVFSGVAPSIATNKLSGMLAGFANMAWNARQIAAKTPKGAAVNAVASYLKGQMVGEGASGFVMEGASHFGAAYDYLTTPQPITLEDYQADIESKAQLFEEEGPLFSPEINGWIDSKDRLDNYIKNNYTFLGENMVPIYLGNGTMIDKVPKTNILKKGLEPHIAIEVAALPSLGVGVINGIIETFSTKHFIEGVSNFKVNDMIGFNWYFKGMQKIEDFARIGSKPGQSVLSRLGRNAPSAVMNMVSNGFTEGTEEVLQGFTDESMGSITWSDEPFNYGFEEIAENFIGGFAGAGITGFNRAASLGLGVAERKRNFMIKNMGYDKDQMLFHTKKNSDGTWSNYFFTSEDKAEKATGTFYNEETGRWEEAYVGGEGDIIVGDQRLPENFDNFRDAFRAAEAMNEYYRLQDEKQTAWDYRGYNDGEVKIVEIEDESGEKKYSVNIFDSKGKILESGKVLDNKYEAKELKETIENNMSNVNRLIQKYGGIEKLKEDEDIKNLELNRENMPNSQGRSESLNEDLNKDKNNVVIGIKAFMNMITGDESPSTTAVINQLYGDILKDPNVVLNLIKNNPDSINSALESLNIKPEAFAARFDEHFDEHAGELVKLMPGKKEINETKRANLAIKAFMTGFKFTESEQEIVDEILEEGLLSNPSVIKDYIENHPDSPIIHSIGKEEISKHYGMIFEESLEFPEIDTPPDIDIGPVQQEGPDQLDKDELIPDDRKGPSELRPDDQEGPLLKGKPKKTKYADKTLDELKILKAEEERKLQDYPEGSLEYDNASIQLTLIDRAINTLEDSLLKDTTDEDYIDTEENKLKQEMFDLIKLRDSIIDRQKIDKDVFRDQNLDVDDIPSIYFKYQDTYEDYEKAVKDLKVVSEKLRKLKGKDEPVEDKKPVKEMKTVGSTIQNPRMLGLGDADTTVGWRGKQGDPLEEHPDMQGETPYERIVLGEKTAHSIPNAAIKSNKISKGEYIKFTDEVSGSTIIVQIMSDPRPVSDMDMNEWADKEGWDSLVWEEGVFDNYSQFDIRVVDPNQGVLFKRVAERVESKTTPEEHKANLNERLEKLSKKFKGKVNYKVHDTMTDRLEADLRALLPVGEDLTGKESAWWDPNTNTIHVIADRSSLSEPFHEFAHPFIRDIRESNKDLYDNVLSVILKEAQIEGSIAHKIINQIRVEYPGLEESSPDRFNEELIVHLIEEMSEAKYKPQSKLMKALNRIWEAIKAALFGSSSYYNVIAADLNPNTTLSELADMIIDFDERFTIDLNEENAFAAEEILQESDVALQNAEGGDNIVEVQGILDSDLIAGDTAYQIETELDSILEQISLDIMNLDLDKDAAKSYKAAQLKLHKSLTDFTNYLKDKYKLNKGLYKGGKLDIDFSLGAKLIADNVSSKVSEILPGVRDTINEKVLDGLKEQIDDLKRTITAVEGKVTFSYKLIDNILNPAIENNPDKPISIKELPSRETIKNKDHLDIITVNGIEIEGRIQNKKNEPDDDGMVNIVVNGKEQSHPSNEVLMKDNKIVRKPGERIVGNVEGHVKQFVKWWFKEYGRNVKSAIPSKIKAGYEAFTLKNDPAVYYTMVQFQVALNYGSLFKDRIGPKTGDYNNMPFMRVDKGYASMDEGLAVYWSEGKLPELKSDEIKVHRIAFHKGHSYKAGHSFQAKFGDKYTEDYYPEDYDEEYANESSSTGFKPLAWYTVVRMPNGRVLMHEYQSDILPEFKETLQKKNAKNIEALISEDKSAEEQWDSGAISKSISVGKQAVENKLHWSFSFLNEKNISKSLIHEIKLQGVDMYGNDLSKEMNILLSGKWSMPDLSETLHNRIMEIYKRFRSTNASQKDLRIPKDLERNRKELYEWMKSVYSSIVLVPNPDKSFDGDNAARNFMDEFSFHIDSDSLEILKQWRKWQSSELGLFAFSILRGRDKGRKDLFEFYKAVQGFKEFVKDDPLVKAGFTPADDTQLFVKYMRKAEEDGALNPDNKIWRKIMAQHYYIEKFKNKFSPAMNLDKSPLSYAMEFTTKLNLIINPEAPFSKQEFITGSAYESILPRLKEYMLSSGKFKKDVDGKSKIRHFFSRRNKDFKKRLEVNKNKDYGKWKLAKTRFRINNSVFEQLNAATPPADTSVDANSVINQAILSIGILGGASQFSRVYLRQLDRMNEYKNLIKYEAEQTDTSIEDLYLTLSSSDIDVSLVKELKHYDMLSKTMWKKQIVHSLMWGSVFNNGIVNFGGGSVNSLAEGNEIATLIYSDAKEAKWFHIQDIAGEVYTRADARRKRMKALGLHEEFRIDEGYGLKSSFRKFYIAEDIQMPTYDETVKYADKTILNNFYAEIWSNVFSKVLEKGGLTSDEQSIIERTIELLNKTDEYGRRNWGKSADAYDKAIDAKKWKSSRDMWVKFFETMLQKPLYYKPGVSELSITEGVETPVSITPETYLNIKNALIDTLSNAESLETKGTDVLPKNIVKVLNSAGTGPWLKVFKEVMKEYGLTSKLIMPEDMATAIYEVDTNQRKKGPKGKKPFIPPMFKRIVSENADSKITPFTIDEMDSKIQKQLSYIDNYRTVSRDFVVNLFEDSWDALDRLSREQFGRKGRADIHDFSAMMIDNLPDELHNDFKQWFLNKFQEEEDKKYRAKSFDKGAKYNWLDSYSIKSHVLQTLNEPGIREGLHELSLENESNERELGVNERQYFQSLKMFITPAQFRQLRAFARRFDTFDEWFIFSMDTILKRSKNVKNEVISNLRKYYNRINSTLKTNGDIESVGGQQVGVPNQRRNLVVYKSLVYDKNSKKKKVKIEIRLKGPKNPLTLKHNAQYEKFTLFEYNNGKNGQKNKFLFLRGNDVIVKKTVEDDQTGRPSTELESSYHFFNKAEMNELIQELARNNMAIAFVRGSDDTLGIVEVTERHKELAKDAEGYWATELGPKHSHLITDELTQGSDFAKAAAIAKHENMKLVWPNYLSNAKGATDIYKRIALPFTPGTISKEMPSVRIRKFDPKEVMFVYNGKSHSPMKPVPGLDDVYIGDGNTLTSKDLFSRFTRYHGLKKDAGKAKTVIYHKNENGNVIAIKHEHVLPRKSWKITDKAGNTLYTIDAGRNIRDANNNIVDMLVTSDEAKIWEVNSDEAIIPGSSLLFTKFDERVKSFVPHGVQWYNHVFDDNIFATWRNNYLPILETEIQKALRMAMPTKKGSSFYVKGFMQKYAGPSSNIGYIPSVVELANLEAGIHPAVAPFLSNALYNNIVKPALHFNKSNGATYDISLDVTGTLEENEVSLSKHQSRMIYNKYAEVEEVTLKEAQSKSIAEINEWLEENIIEVSVSRYPIPHAAGMYIARVKSIHNRNGLSDLNHINVKRDLEGDGDGDKVQIELLNEEVLDVYKNYIRNLKLKSVNLNNYSSKKYINPLDARANYELMYKSTLGERAIGEIANIQTAYAILANTFSHVKIAGIRYRIKRPDEQIKWNVKGWEGGTVSEYLRVMLQGALDNPQYGVLGEWKYEPGVLFTDASGQEKVWMKLFEMDHDGVTKEFSPVEDVSEFRHLRKTVLKILKIPSDIRRGENFDDGSLSLTKTIEYSQRYNGLMSNGRVGFINEMNEQGINLEFVEGRNRNALLPIELIAISISQQLSALDNKYELFGYDVNPYLVSENVHKNAHYDALEYVESILESAFKSAMERDNQTDLEWSTKERKEGTFYAQNMIKRFYNELAKFKNDEDIDASTLDRNEDFIAFKDEFHSKFKELSNVAKIAATITFLRGYEKKSNNLDKMIRVNFPKVIPPSSFKPSEYSLLSPSLLKEYFLSYNDNVAYNRKAESVRGRPTGEILDRLLKDICGK